MDLHDRFDDWLTAGAEGDPPRDLALHASACDACRRSVATVDSLQAIDVGGAPLPPLRVAPEPTDTVPRTLRYAVGAVAVILLATSVAIGASGVLRPTQPAAEPTQTPDGDVLAGAPSARATSRPATDDPTASGSASPTPTPTATEAAVAGATPAPVQAPAPRPPLPQPPGTPEPTAPPPAPTAAPTTAPTTAPPIPSPTASPPTPSAAPSSADPSPTPTPPPSNCADGEDNDLDGLVDALDPDCPIDGYESGILP